PADLHISDTGPASATAGNTVTYTIVATNDGVTDVSGATVTDTFPASITGITYSSTITGTGSDSNTTGAGGINDVVTLSSGSSITYTVVGTLSNAAGGNVVDTATVTAPSNIFDANLVNNTASTTAAVTSM